MIAWRESGIVASNGAARAAAATEARRLGFEVRVNDESLYDDVPTGTNVMDLVIATIAGR